MLCQKASVWGKMGVSLASFLRVEERLRVGKLGENVSSQGLHFFICEMAIVTIITMARIFDPQTEMAK